MKAAPFYRVDAWSRLFSIACMALAAGCAPHYYGTLRTEREPITQLVFDELSSMKRIGVAPISFSTVRFRLGEKKLTEDEAFAGKSAEKRASWDADKAAMVEMHAAGMMVGAGALEIVSVPNAEAAADVEYVLVPEAVLVDPGYFATALFNADALLVLEISLVRVSDEAVIYKWSERESSNVGVSSGQRMRALAAVMAQANLRTLGAFAEPKIEPSSPRAARR